MHADDLREEYRAEKRYVDEEKPYWLYLDAEDELSWELFNYFPDAHYRQAIDTAREEQRYDEVPDGW